MALKKKLFKINYMYVYKATNVVENENVISTTVSFGRVCNGMNFQSSYFVNGNLNIIMNKV